MQGGDCFDEALEQVQLAEKHGFNSAFLTEHHGWNMSWPTPQMALAAMATRTETISLGTSIILLPLGNPVRIAGEFALLDQISNGRAILGAGLGYQEREFEAMNIDIQGRVTRFVDYIRVIGELFEDENATYDGKSFTLPEFTLSPSPVQPQGPPIWCGGRVDAAFKRAALFGDEWIPSWTDSLERVSADKKRYTKYLREYNSDPAEHEFPIIRSVIIAETHEEATERARTHFQPIIERYLEEGYQMGVDPETFTDIMDIIEERFFVGNPEEVTKQIEEFINAYGTDHLVFKVYGPGMTHEDVTATLRLLGDEVLPKLD